MYIVHVHSFTITCCQSLPVIAGAVVAGVVVAVFVVVILIVVLVHWLRQR